MSAESPEYSPFFAVMGASAAMVFSALGAAYGTAKSGTGIAAMSVMRPELIMKSIIPVVMAGIIAIYGLVVAVLIANNISEKVSLYRSFLHLGAGLSVGLSGLAAGFAIGIVGDAGVRGTKLCCFGESFRLTVVKCVSYILYITKDVIITRS
uniref:V-type proton ATPase proteolipid subunit n=1 Tax=Periophthalmus magnuspinnatus TaxID=409849 RepID=A0A3B3ZND9_9GOBI